MSMEFRCVQMVSARASVKALRYQAMGFGKRKEWEQDEEIDEVIPLDEKLYQADFAYDEDSDDDDDVINFPPVNELDDDDDSSDDFDDLP